MGPCPKPLYAPYPNYTKYRILSIIVTQKGTVLIFCEGRAEDGGDSGDIDLLVKRSSDNG